MGRTALTADETFWDWLLERDSKSGLYKQTIISQVPSELLDDYAIYKEAVMSKSYKLDDKTVSDSTKSRLLREWMDKNAKINKEALFKAQTEFIEGLEKEGMVTSKEKNVGLLMLK